MARQIEFLVVLLTCIGILFGAYTYLDQKHAQEVELHRTRLEMEKELFRARVELQSEILDRDLKKNAEARVYYKDIERTRGLEPPEKARLEYLEEQMALKYDEQRQLRQAKMKVDGADG